MTERSKNKRYVRIERYDALSGKHIRDIKPTDIFTLNAAPIPAAPATNIATTIVGANFDLFVHRVDISCSATNKHVAIMENSTTKVIISMQGVSKNSVIAQSRDLPLFKVAASSTLKIRPVVAGHSTYVATLYAIREPIITKVETT